VCSPWQNPSESVSKIATREARKKLRPSGKPYLEDFEKGLDFGYRKGKRAGSWVIRRYLGERKYAVDTIGTADDDPGADPAQLLTYHQARDEARKRTQALADESRIARLGPTVTVRSATESYIGARDAREQAHAINGENAPKGLKRDARSRLGKHVLADEKLSAKPLATITSADLIEWRNGLPVGAGDRLARPNGRRPSAAHGSPQPS
jgi:hypothetical protein